MTSALAAKEDWQAALDVASTQIDVDWCGAMFKVAQAYGRITPDDKKDDWTEEKLSSLFTVTETALVYDTAQVQVLSEVHDAAGKALLVKLWIIYQAGKWVLLRPDTSTNDEDWSFGDYAATALENGVSTSEDYHRKLALICERVFNWLKINPAADENGERIDAMYLIRRFGPYILTLMSQFFTKNPTNQQIRDMLAEVLTSPSPASAIENHKAKLDRVILGTQDNVYYMRELEGGAAAFHIVLTQQKHVKKLRKFLAKFGEERSWASPKDVIELPEEQHENQG